MANKYRNRSRAHSSRGLIAGLVVITGQSSLVRFRSSNSERIREIGILFRTWSHFVFPATRYSCKINTWEGNEALRVWPIASAHLLPLRPLPLPPAALPFTARCTTYLYPMLLARDRLQISGVTVTGKLLKAQSPRQERCSTRMILSSSPRRAGAGDP